jgi:hypothetical protein
MYYFHRAVILTAPIEITYEIIVVISDIILGQIESDCSGECSK